MVIYEWDIETIDDPTSDDPQIQDHHHADKLSEFEAISRIRLYSLGWNERLCLVRDDNRGRSWAYVIGSGVFEFPCFFDASDIRVAPIPKRYIDELAKSRFSKKG